LCVAAPTLLVAGRGVGWIWHRRDFVKPGDGYRRRVNRVADAPRLADLSRSIHGSGYSSRRAHWLVGDVHPEVCRRSWRADPGAGGRRAVDDSQCC
jgi:hypothetical protein